MKSMTGFGVGEAPLGQGKLVAEVRTVNHRYLDVRVRLPKELGECGMFVEQVTRSRLSRGRCEVCVRAEGGPIGPSIIDHARVRAAFKAFSEIRDELVPGAEIPLTLLSAIPDLFVPALDDNLPRTREVVQAALLSALDDLDTMRAREGEALEHDMRSRAQSLRAFVDSIEGRLPDVVAHYRKRIRDRIRLLAASASELALDDLRLEQEVVLYADRTDISEELTRLRIHLESVLDLLGSREPSGRRLDFLLQEVGREINTIGAKSQDAHIARAVVEAKAEVERMREQVQNVE
jgi:uncharacterized protein (TIGR00255 family)